MASITSSVGLASGIDIVGTVDQLMEIASVPRDNLVSRNEVLNEEQEALTELMTYLYTLQSLAVNLGEESLYENKTATSSNSSALIASVDNEDAATGSYTFTTIQMAQSEQWLTDGVANSEAALGGGTFSFRFGDDLQRPLSLDTLNGGDGIERGSIRITDRSGASADIDLSKVQTLDDVISAINTNSTINVTAELHGDGIRLIDDTGQTDANLQVKEVDGGSTAASLGLAEIDVAADVADGTSLVSLFRDLSLTQLNDGNGVQMAWDMLSGDIGYTLADGTTGTIDFTPLIDASHSEEPPSTLGELIDLFNAAQPGKLELAIAEDGTRLVVNDLTEGEGTFSLSSKSENLSNALADLGLTGTAVEGEILGRRIIGGTGSVLVSTLNGGSTETLGSISLTDRSGANVEVDLSDAETVEEVLDAINAAAAGASVSLTAELNSAKNGIRIVDTSGETTSNLIIASVGEPDTAALLGITADVAATTVESGDLHQKIISYNTLLDDLNGGAGIARGSFMVIDSDGKATAIDLSDTTIQTVGDLVYAATQGAASVLFDINPDGDGIVIKDNAGGAGIIQVVDDANGTAASLQLTGGQEIMEIDGEQVKAINGSMTHVIELDSDDSLEDLVSKINEVAGGATATILNDGSSRPYRMTLKSDASGLSSAIVLDTSALDLGFQKTVAAQNAVITLGSADSGVFITSASNSFTGVVENVTLQVNAVSDTPTTITVARSNTQVVSAVMAFVDSYNSFRELYNELTAFDEETMEGAILFTDPAVRQVGNMLSSALTDRYSGTGTVQSLRQVGVTFNSDGTLTFDESVLEDAFAENPEDVKTFFTTVATEDSSIEGFATIFDDVIESVAGGDYSTLITRYDFLTNKVANNEDRINFLDERLAAQRERLLWDFYYMELAISKIQSYSSVLDSIEYIGMFSSDDDT